MQYKKPYNSFFCLVKKIAKCFITQIDFDDFKNVAAATKSQLPQSQVN